MSVKLKNKVNPLTEKFICNGKCGRGVSGIARLIKGLVYCLKDYEIQKEIRDERGLKIK